MPPCLRHLGPVPRLRQLAIVLGLTLKILAASLVSKYLFFFPRFLLSEDIQTLLLGPQMHALMCALEKEEAKRVRLIEAVFLYPVNLRSN